MTEQSPTPDHVELLDLADNAVAWALDNFCGYSTDEMDAGIHYMQARGKDRWSMQAQMEHPECFGCNGTTTTLAGEPCPLCQPEPTPDSEMVLVMAREALQAVVSGASRSFKARNGKLVSIEADDGEACDILHSDVTYECERVIAKIDALAAARPSPAPAAPENPATVALLREALDWIDAHCDDPDMGHIKFRVGAGARVRLALAATQGAE